MTDLARYRTNQYTVKLASGRPVIESIELSQVLSEAEEIARSVNQKLTSAHQLLALFTIPNRAEVLLKDRGIDEDRILAALQGIPREPDGIERQLRDRARELAQQLAEEEVDCLHLLIAMSRVRVSMAHQLLSDCGLQLSSLRNIALSYFTSRMPRRLQRLAVDPAAVRTQLVGQQRVALPNYRPAPQLPLPAPSLTTALLVPVLEPPQNRTTEALETQEGATGLSLDPQRFPWLSALGRNLTELAHRGRLDPLIGREHEVEEALDVLGKRRSNNPMLIGDPGVGKSAIVEGIAQRLLEHHERDGVVSATPPRLVIELDVANLVAGTQLRGSFSEKLNGIKDEVRQAGGRVIVFIDEIHMLMGAGSTGDGPQDAANELKAALARGEFPCIGATTHDEYRQHIEKDPALCRRFAPIAVREPPIADALSIAKGLQSRYAAHHRVRYTDEAIEASVTLTSRYVKDRFLPDKALAALDVAGSRARREGKNTVVTLDVARVVAKMAGIPESRLIGDDTERILGLRAALAERIVGHDLQVARICDVLQRNYAGFASQRPLGSFLFLGPTGVGKTELARTLAEALFGSRDALVELDMSECSEQTGVARLLGAAPGYVGYGDGGQLTEAVRRRPSSVVVLDEIEKAHRDVLMLLLQVMEEGRLTDGRGRQIDFSNTVLVMTSNLGADVSQGRGGTPMGFASIAAPTSAATIEESPEQKRVKAAVKDQLAPELWGRIDDQLVFSPLDREQVAVIARRLLKNSSERIEKERKISYWASDAVVELLLSQSGFGQSSTSSDASLGARPLRNNLQRLLEGPLADRVLRGELREGDRVWIDITEGQLSFSRTAQA